MTSNLLQYSTTKWWLLCLSLSGVGGCVSSSTNDLHLRDQLIPLVGENGQQNFDYTMTWFVPPRVLFGNERRSIIANMGLQSTAGMRAEIDLDKETRLQLEDLAVRKLESALREQDLCPSGYQIEQTRWLDRSISFRGRCKSNNGI